MKKDNRLNWRSLLYGKLSIIGMILYCIVVAIYATIAMHQPKVKIISYPTKIGDKYYTF